MGNFTYSISIGTGGSKFNFQYDAYSYPDRWVARVAEGWGSGWGWQQHAVYGPLSVCCERQGCIEVQKLLETWEGVCVGVINHWLATCAPCS